MSINSRDKGAGGEREAAAFLTNLFQLPVRRGCQYRGGPDSPDVAGLAGLAIEVKRRARLHLESSLQQAARDAHTNAVPLVLHRANHEDWKLTIYGKDLLRFLEVANHLIEEGERRDMPAESQNQTPKNQPKEKSV